MTLVTMTSLKPIIFQAHTLVVTNIKTEITKMDKVGAHNILPATERFCWVREQQGRLQGLRFRGDEEYIYVSHDLLFSIMERNCLIYLPPECFVTRKYALLQEKPGKEIILDHNALTLKEKQGEYSCSKRTELDLFQAIHRHTLAFDLKGIYKYEIFNSFHSELLHHL